MPFWRFTLYTVLGCLPWVFFLGWVGTRVGANWESIREQLRYADYVVAVAILYMSPAWPCSASVSTAQVVPVSPVCKWPWY